MNRLEAVLHAKRIPDEHAWIVDKRDLDDLLAVASVVDDITSGEEDDGEALTYVMIPPDDYRALLATIRPLREPA